MFEENIFEKALHITNPWYIKEVKFDEQSKRLDIYVDFHKGAEFFYESLEEGISGNYKAYDTEEKVWRHLNFFEHECYIHARTPRVKISGKEKDNIRLVSPPWTGKCPGFTLLFEALVLQLAKAMPVHTLCSIIKESDYKIWNILEKYIEESRVKLDFSKLRFIGLDETSKKKGHDYITLFVDLEQKRTIFITEGKDSSTINSFKKDLIEHKGKAENITKVSCDMSPAFIKGVKKELPNAKITFDKFHIMKIINRAVDEVRKLEVKSNPILKKSKYVFLKNEKNLKSLEKGKLSQIQLSKQNLKTIRAYNLRVSFQQIYAAIDEKEFEILLKKWYFWATHSKIDSIKKVAKTIKNHWEGILAWKKSQINNGILEGLNSLIQAAKSKARGFKTFKKFKIVAYLITGKFDFTKINKYYLPT